MLPVAGKTAFTHHVPDAELSTMRRRSNTDDEALLWTLEGVSAVTRIFWIDSSTTLPLCPLSIFSVS